MRKYIQFKYFHWRFKQQSACFVVSIIGTLLMYDFKNEIHTQLGDWNSPFDQQMHRTNDERLKNKKETFIIRKHLCICKWKSYLPLNRFVTYSKFFLRYVEELRLRNETNWIWKKTLPGRNNGNNGPRPFYWITIVRRCTERCTSIATNGD